MPQKKAWIGAPARYGANFDLLQMLVLVRSSLIRQPSWVPKHNLIDTIDLLDAERESVVGEMNWRMN